MIVVQNELKTDFDEVVVKWVDCPNLTDIPFCLAAPGKRSIMRLQYLPCTKMRYIFIGLCGDTAILDIGGMKNLFPLPKKEKVFYFKNILEELNRTQINNLIIGGGLCIKQSSEGLGQLIMNALFSPTDESMVLTNQSIFAQQQMNSETCSLSRRTTKHFSLTALIADQNPNCNIYGNFFVSKGLREQVLEVKAKKRIGRDFIDALQHAICRFPHKTDSQLMGFGGIFMVKNNGKAIQHVIQNDWKFPIYRKDELRSCVRYWNVTLPVVGFTTFLNADRHVVATDPGLREVFLTRWRAHSYSYFDYGGGQYRETTYNHKTEYTGYFSPATKLYRIDPVSIFCEMADFSYLEIAQ